MRNPFFLSLLFSSQVVTVAVACAAFPVSVLTYTMAEIGDPAGLDGFVLDWGRRFPS
jgi:hypothetical protein